MVVEETPQIKPSVLSERLRLDFINTVAEKKELWNLELIKAATREDMSANQLLYEAARLSNLTGVKWLLENMNVDVNWQNEKGMTALMTASSRKFSKVSRFFGHMGMEMWVYDMDDRNAKIIKELRKAGADTTIRNNEGQSAPGLAYNSVIRKAFRSELGEAEHTRTRLKR